MDPVSKAQQEKPRHPKWRETSFKGRTPHSFVPGISGNPSGRPKRKHITKIYEKILAKPENRKQIAESIMRILVKGGMSSVLLQREMAERIEGKVVQEMAVEISGNLTLEQVLEAKKKAGK